MITIDTERIKMEVSSFLSEYDMRKNLGESELSEIRNEIYFRYQRENKLENAIWINLWMISNNIVDSGDNRVSENFMKLGWDHNNKETDIEQTLFTEALIEMCIPPFCGENSYNSYEKYIVETVTRLCMEMDINIDRAIEAENAEFVQSFKEFCNNSTFSFKTGFGLWKIVDQRESA